jgi:hypothetical protein
MVFLTPIYSPLFTPIKLDKMTNVIEQATQTIVKFKEKSVYGGTLIYPNNEPATLFADLINKKTFSRRDLSIIADLGFRIELIKL